MFSLEGYEVVALIGQGGLGDVYEARQLSTGATVAVKVLREVAGEPAALHRLQREMEALAALGGQSNVIRLLDVVESDVGPALVMEFAPGGSIASMLIERDQVLATDEVAFIGEQVASALAAAHQHGIIHRDVKPQNLLVDAYGAVKLCDFGIAAITRSEQFQTRTTALSVRYASPEDLEQDAEIGEASDVYSLGATLLHLSHGAPPTLRERVQAWIPPGRPDPYDNDLDVVISECLRPDPTARPSATEVAHRLDEIGAQFSPRCRSLAASSAEPQPTAGPELPPEPKAMIRTTDESDLAFSDDVASDESSPSPSRSDWVDRAPPDYGAILDMESLAHPTSSVHSDDDAGPTNEVRPGDCQPVHDQALDRAGVRRPTFRSEKRTRLVSRVVTVLSVVMVAVLIGTLGWRVFLHHGTPDHPLDGRGQRTIVAQTDGTISLEGVVFPTVAVGQCLGIDAGTTQARVVSCGDVHDGEVLVVDRVPATLDGTFEADQVDSIATDICDGVDLPRIQESADTQQASDTQTALRVLVVSPSADSWEQGDRRLMCVLAAPHARIAGVTN